MGKWWKNIFILPNIYVEYLVEWEMVKNRWKNKIFLQLNNSLTQENGINKNENVEHVFKYWITIKKLNEKIHFSYT